MKNFLTPQQIDVNGVSLEVYSGGDPSAPALVLCHGWPEHAYSWRHQVHPLIEAGYHVIVPNQRGYGQSSRPDTVEDYAIEHLTGDLVALLDYFGHENAVFVGHDWGAIIVWNLAMMHRERVAGVINLSVSFMERGQTEWVGFWEKMLGPDFYIVHFNRQPGVADKVLGANSRNFLTNFFKTNQWLHPKPDLPGMTMIALAEAPEVPGDPIMGDDDLQVFVDAFEHSTYTGGLNWYRNFTRNWHTIGEFEQRVSAPTLFIYGAHDMVPPPSGLERFVPDLEIVELPCGHWIQQEEPEAVLALMQGWLRNTYPS